MEDPTKDQEPSLEDYLVLKEYEYVFREFPGLPLKRDIEFYIEFIPGVSLVSKAPYRMITPNIKDLQMQL